MSLRVTRQYTDVLGNGSGNARVTRQYVDVLGSGSGKARVTRQYVDILSDAYPSVFGTVTDNLTVTDTCGCQKDIFLGEADTLTVSESATCRKEIPADASDSLSVSEQTIGYVAWTTSESFHVTEVASYNVDRERLSDDTLALSESSSRQLVRLEDGEDTLSVSESSDAEYVKPSNDTVVIGEVASTSRTYSRVLVDSLTVSETIGLTKIVSLYAQDTITVVENSVFVSERERTTSDTVSVSESPDAEYCKPSNDSVSIVDSASADVVKPVEDTLEVEEYIEVGFIRNLTASDTVTIRERTNPGQYACVAGDVLQRELLTVDPVTFELITTYIGLSDEASLTVVRDLPFQATDSVSIGERSTAIRIRWDAIPLDADDTVTVSESADTNKTPTSSDSLVLVEAASLEVVKPVSGEDLEILEEATASVERYLSASDLLEVEESYTQFNGLENQIWVYHPNVGGGTGSAPSVTLPGPMEGITAPFQLVYPSTGVVTDSVTLRSPELGNKDTLTFNRILRETRGGTLISYADPQWPKVQTHSLNFKGLTRSEAQDLLDFFTDYLGLEVGMIDWEQRYWRGIIVSPEEPIVEDSFNNYSASFKFEGELDATWLPQTIPWIPGTPLRRVRKDYTPVNPMEPEPAPEMPDDAYNAIADSTMVAGTVIYVKSNGHIDRALADALPESSAMGLLYTDVSEGHTGYYITEGRITKTDWTAITGTAMLTPGAMYFVSPTVAGGLTTNAPTAGYVVHAARATSSQTIDIEVEDPIRL